MSMEIKVGDIVRGKDSKRVGIVCDSSYMSLTRIISCVWDVTNPESKSGDGWEWGPDGKYILIESGNYSESDLKDPKVIEKLKNYEGYIGSLG